MKLVSTRDIFKQVSPAEAIVKGLSDEGGLFAPVNFPAFSLKDIVGIKSYSELASFIASAFLSDFTHEELSTLTADAYKDFPENAAPIISLDKYTHILELYHGPTLAFKDFALQLLPRLLVASLKKTGEDKTAVILAATSGDTGSAALEGFGSVDGVKICVFYPQLGISNVQKLQMTSQNSKNAKVVGLRGNFDDAQSGVKQIFADKELAGQLSEKGYIFSSANSINWGRIVPQIVYYFWAYASLVRGGKVALGERVNVAVPTGNFGNILAAYYAKKCGLPIHKLICASNSNNVLSDFITTGVYDKNRDFHVTASPSMDILVSSNLERLLFDLHEYDDAKIKDLMQKLASSGRYELNTDALAAMQDSFYAGYADDGNTLKSISGTWRKHGYLSDTHTAVGIKVHEEYMENTGDTTPTIIASTASPFKFADSVILALGGALSGDDFERLELLREMSGVSVPHVLKRLAQKEELHKTKCCPGEMRGQVLDWLTDIRRCI